MPSSGALAREKARTALGSTFVDKAFNDALVLGGNVPLDVLARNVDEYVRTAKGAVRAPIALSVPPAEQRRVIASLAVPARLHGTVD